MTKAVTKKTALISELKPHPKNYQMHPEDQLEHLRQRIKQYGIYREVVIAKEDKTILAGHGIVEAARSMGMTRVPVFELDIKWDSPEAMKLLAGDNEVSHLAIKNDRQLSDMLKDIKENGESLLGTGFDEMSLAAFVLTTRTSDEIEDIDAAQEWAGMPGSSDAPERLAMTIYFDSQEDMDALVELAELSPQRTGGAGKGKATPTAWYPHREKNDWASLRIEAADEDHTEAEV